VTDSHSQHDLDQWLRMTVTALHHTLDEVLDLDAGFADARLPELQTNLIAELDTALDLDAGLVDILPTRAGHEGKGSRSSEVFDNIVPKISLEVPNTPLIELANDLLSRPPGERLAVRAWLPLPRLVYIKTIARIAVHTWDLALKIDRLPSEENIRKHLDRFNASHTKGDDDYYYIDYYNRYSYPEICTEAAELAATLDDTRKLVPSFDYTNELFSSSEHIAKLAKTMEHAQTIGDRLTKAMRPVDRVNDHEVRGIMEVIRNDADQIIEFFKAARDQAGNLKSSIDRLRSLTINDTRDLVKGFDEELTQALESALEDPADVRRTLFDCALVGAVSRFQKAITDVTGQDLSEVNLNGVPLEGLRWSDGSTGPRTQWPTEWRDEIWQNSIEISPGIYDVYYGGVEVNSSISH
jgi:hypothetical protein